MNFSGPLSYTPPSDATYLEPIGALRDASLDLPTLRALVPDHVARTAEASPTLYWFLSEDIERSVEFVLADTVSIDPILEITVEPPLRAGIHAWRLADHGVALEPGVSYRWFVSLSPDHLTRGAVERIEPGRELETRLTNVAPDALGQTYAAEGLWYDALASISAGIDRGPGDARLRDLRADLLDKAGLADAAEYDRAAARGSAND